MRPLFRNKNLHVTLQGNCTDVGLGKFEQARERLAKLAKRPATAVSDGDVIEYQSRGHQATVEYFKAHPPKPYETSKTGPSICPRCKARKKLPGKSRCAACLEYARKYWHKTEGKQK